MKVLRGIAWLVPTLLAVLLWNCGGADSFRIMGEIDGLGTQNLQVVYYGDGAFRSMRSTAVDGKFSIEGSSRDYTVVDVFTSTRSHIASCIVKNGDHVECALELNNPVPKKIKGGDAAVELMRWIGENERMISSGQTEQLNAAVADFIGKNSDNVVSSVLLTRYFDARGREQEADSLLRSISQRARITSLTEGYRDGLVYNADSVLPTLGDSLWFVGVDRKIVYAAPHSRRATLLYFSNPSGARVGSNDKLLHNLINEHKTDGKVSVIEINDVDNADDWEQTVKNDSLPWERVWHPGVSSTLALPSRPWVIVADSLGRIRYNGADFFGAVGKVSELCL